MPNRIQSYRYGILDMADAVKRKVVRDGVRARLERDAAVERWLREEVVPGH